MSLPVIAIIGRPNVGKSTLFNRIVGKRYAITSSSAGTTRDRVYHEIDAGTYRAILVDTAGLDFDSAKKGKDLEADIQAQARVAVEEANIILLIIDAGEELTSVDYDCASYLRKSKKPVILVLHKADNKKSEQMLAELYKFGFGEAILVSSIHNLGISDLLLVIQKKLKKMGWKANKRDSKKRGSRTAIAIVGRPNVGKSSIVNALLGEKRLIVSDIPGTTIDATDTAARFGNYNFILTDTAGLRRRGKIGKGIERYGVMRALQAISRSDVACLVVDVDEGLSNQDLHISEYVLEAGRGLVIVVNKTDLMKDPDKGQKTFLNLLHYRMSYIPWAPVLFVSALKKKNVFKIFELAHNIAAERRRKVPPGQFDIFVKTAVLTHPPAKGSKKIVISEGFQSGIEPPTFTLITNEPDLIHFSYRRFLENEIRRKFGFYGTAIKLEFKRARR